LKQIIFFEILVKNNFKSSTKQINYYVFNIENRRQNVKSLNKLWSRSAKNGYEWDSNIGNQTIALYIDARLSGDV